MRHDAQNYRRVMHYTSPENSVRPHLLPPILGYSRSVVTNAGMLKRPVMLTGWNVHALRDDDDVRDHGDVVVWMASSSSSMW
mmetsp:Transcript_3673/g.8892  ORF Transcript_3673/g.8892 Transcript_3673/m.8892 type:complete len:82 (-) Transcript_3673:1325-1570(-)